VKAYRVTITATAKQNLRDGYVWAAQHAPESAARWLGRFYDALQTLSTNPERCGVAPESVLVGCEVRQFLFGKGRNVWRALFLIDDDEVRVLHVRRAAMDVARPEDLGD
jgi:plasmid stabilization system protein ParE